MYLSKALSSNLPAIAGVCDAGQSGMRVAWLSINSNASAVAFILNPVSDSQPDSRIFVWQLASDRVQVFDLATGETRSLDDTAAKTPNKEHLEVQGNFDYSAGVVELSLKCCKQFFGDQESKFRRSIG